MLLVKHHIQSSSIHGLGVFASEPIMRGQVTWKFDPVFDVEITADLFISLSSEDAEFVINHAEYYPDRNTFVLGNDGDIFMNHSEDPSLHDLGDSMVAARYLKAGEELTCDYRSVLVLGFEPLPLRSRVGWMTSGNAQIQ